MELLRRLDHRWRSFRHGETADGLHEDQGHEPAEPPHQLDPAQHTAAPAAGGRYSPDLAGSSTDQGSARSSQASTPVAGFRAPPRAALITALAGYDLCDSAGSSELSRVTPLRVQALDEIEIEVAPKDADGKSSRLSTSPKKGTTAGRPAAGVAGAEGAPAVSRRSFAARCAAVVSAAAGGVVHSTQQQLAAAHEKAAGLLRKASAQYLPTTAAAAAAAPSRAEGPCPRAPWQQKLRMTWQQHPVIALVCSLLFLMVVGLLLGVAIGVSARNQGSFPWWAKGGGDPGDMWVPSGDSQLDALMRIKAALDTHDLLTGWRPENGRSSGYCSWDFVTCGADGKTVQELNLTTNTYFFVLEGQLPSGEALSGLTGLTSLDIREHHIAGTLPEDWALLPLGVVRLDQNMLQGEVPAAWFAPGPLSSSLKVLTLWDNKLSGGLPDASPGAMKSLEQLDLSFNGLTGSLPSSWSGLSSLQQLWLDVNQLSGPLPSSWSGLTALRKLLMSENSLSGALPPSWGEMRSLEEMWIEYNNVSGQLPESFKSLSHLQTLVLNNNNLSLTVPPAWSDLRALQSVYLYNNSGLMGCLPSSWEGQLHADFDVGYYLMEGTGLTGFCTTRPQPASQAVPKPPGTAPTTEELPITTPTAPLPKGKAPQDRSIPPRPSKGPRPSVPVKPKPPRGPVTPPAPVPKPPKPAVLQKATAEAQLASLLQLKAALDTTGVLDSVWDPATGANGGFCSWLYIGCDAGKVVRTINLTTNQYESIITGRLPPGRVFAGLPGLRRLDIRMHNVNGSLPRDWVRYMPSIQVLRLDQNKLSGWLPSEWAGMTALEVLTLYENKLSGPLPPSWAALTALRQFDLSYNSLGGQLPEGWGSWSKVRTIHLDVNELRGPLPASWGAMSSLEKLVLSENSLTGPLPGSWSGMQQLRELWLEYNQLSGPLPKGFSALRRTLTKLLLNNNNFTGAIPSTWSQLRKLDTLHVYNNPGLVGCVPRDLKQHLLYDTDYYINQGTSIKGFCAS